MRRARQLAPASVWAPESDTPSNVFRRQIPHPQVRQVIAGIKQLLHPQGQCPLAIHGGLEIADIGANVRQMDNFMDRLNDSMHEELMQLVLDIMGHLGIAQ